MIIKNILIVYIKKIDLIFKKKITRFFFLKIIKKYKFNKNINIKKYLGLLIYILNIIAINRLVKFVDNNF